MITEETPAVRASAWAEAVYDALLQQVVEPHLLSDRNGQLDEKRRRLVDAQKFVDPRTVRLLSLSGKGGKGYPQYTNVTLLDHLLSVARGALVLAAQDWLTQNPEMAEALAKQRLALIAAIAILHDLDKDLELPRNAPLTTTQVRQRMKQYGLDAFLTRFQLEVSPEHMLSLIAEAESTQSQRYLSQMPLPAAWTALAHYVRLADKLDGAWLNADPEQGGSAGVLRRLTQDQSALRSPLLRAWQVLEIFDPHHPFLLDELQRWLSWWSRHLTGLPPLVEVHHDGRLVMLLPAAQYTQIQHQAINSLVGQLPFALELNISNQGTPSLQGVAPNYPQLRAFVAGVPLSEISRLFFLKAELKPIVTAPLTDLLVTLELTLRWPSKTTGLLSPLYNLQAEDDHARLRDAALLALLLNLKLDIGRSPIPDSNQREQQLLATLGTPAPGWLAAVSDGLSRRNLTALWVTALCVEDAAQEAVIFGSTGLLHGWLEGSATTAGLASLITGKGATVGQAVREHFAQLLAGVRVHPADETAQGRCLFTNAPTPLIETVDSASGLYGVKVSAFSGREGRPENVTGAPGHTNVGWVSFAEHKIRGEAHAHQGGKDDGIPILVSTPTTSALFGGLLLTDDQRLPSLSLYDLARLEVKKGRVIHGPELYRGRYRLARLERLADKSEAQVNQLRMLLEAALRLGRPLHLFRGLPSSQRAFFHFDAMPPLLQSLIGGNSLHLEEIPAAIQTLKLAHTLLDTAGLGYGVLRLYAHPTTRLAGIATAWCGLKDKEAMDLITLRILEKQFQTLKQQEINMHSEAGALVRLGQAATTIQKYVGMGDSASRQLMVFKLGINALESARQLGQTDRASLLAAVAGELEENLTRRGEAVGRTARDGKPLAAGCQAVATLLVDDFWFGVLKGHSPSQRQLRTLGNIYRMSFLFAYQATFQEKKAAEAAVSASAQAPIPDLF